MIEMPAGTRVRMNGKCPWLSRVGCLGVVVAPLANGTYPQPSRGEVLVLLDDDPLGWMMHTAGWSCVVSVASLDVLGSASAPLRQRGARNS